VVELRERLQETVGTQYRIERELGGGGMSRVFLAEEVALERQVVIKVLPPEMAVGVNADRFRREILLAARLQHPHVVPLLTAGAAGDLLYYVMPFIKGESLRARLAREGELPLADAVRILRDVADALAFAHGEGVVHRDIKPDNVLLAGGHALVTDFGVAKAVASAVPLTSLGVALGTPAYMAPEQAVASPQVDHRADIYALGVMAYEMLTGQPPFTGPNLQAVLSAHVMEEPEPVTKYRETVPPAMTQMVMRCLAKKAADRFQRAEELIPLLDRVLTPAPVPVTPTGSEPLAAPERGQAPADSLLRVTALVAVASLGVAALAYGVVRLAGLPDWVFLGALGLVALGLPILFLTGYFERRRARARVTGEHAATPPGVRRLFTWRRAITGGGLAFAGLTVVAGGFMAMRALGIGPAATLLSSGRLAARARVLVAEFSNRTSDSTLGPSLAEAFRIDLSQSPVIRVMAPDEIGRVLDRMERPESTRVTPAVAREIAEREGVPAVIEGDVGTVGGGYVLSARVVAAADGSELLAARETAANEAEILPALARLSTHVRERIGESYGSLRGTAPLEQVTTSSLEALRLYSRGSQAARAGDFQQAIDLLEQAVAMDSGFAMAYRLLAATVGTLFRGSVTQRDEAASAAFRHRDRLPPRERYLTEAYYYATVEYDPARLVTAYQTVLAIDPDEPTALNNLASEYMDERQWAQAEPLYRRAIAVSDSGLWQPFTNMAQAEFALGHADAARHWLHAAQRKFPSLPPGFGFEAALDYAEGKYDSAAALARSTGFRFPVARRPQAFIEASALWVQGRLAEAEAVRARREQLDADAGDSTNALWVAIEGAEAAIRIRGRADSGLQFVEAALGRYPVDHIAPADRPWGSLVRVYAAADRPREARAVLERWQREVPAAARRGAVRATAPYDAALGTVVLAEGHPGEARTALERAVAYGGCNACYQDLIGQTWEAEGKADSAVAAYDRFLDEPEMFRAEWDAMTRAGVLLRAAELDEQLGRRAQAVSRYSALVDLWKKADPDLQPVVTDVKARLARLTREGG
jgi:tetratricopeptide (TPR) repeat protein